MRVLIAPGSFGPELPAVEAAAAIAAGWARRAPGDELALAPVCDAGAGFVDVLHHSLGGDLLAVSGCDAFGVPTPGVILVVGDSVYVEAAQVVRQAAEPIDPDSVDPESASSLGVGRLVAEALAVGVTRVVVGVGASGVACNDGGAGLLAGLGVRSDPVSLLTQGSIHLGSLASVDLEPALELARGARVVFATDDEVPLLGLLGTTNAAGISRGLSAERIPGVDARLEHLADLLGRRPALLPGAGAGGGIGYALLLLGATTAPGLATVMAEIDLSRRAAASDLVVTGERAFDLSAGSGLVATGVAAIAGSVVRPCIALANRVAVGARETRALGIESAYAVPDRVAGAPGSSAAERLADLAERVARTWSWSR